MRHLSPEELLLYAEGELDEQALCRHVPDCVDCKAQLVDLQETCVLAAQALRSHAQALPAQPAQLQRLRQRLAAEAELLSAHLSTEQLLLLVENGLGAEGQTHLAACTGCQRQAADLHVQLAEIETELHRRFAYELPAERRAAALAALRSRLEEEVERRTAEVAGPWRWLPTFSLPRIPAFAPHATAFATACLAMLVWSAASLTEGVPDPGTIARLATPAAPVPELSAPALPESAATAADTAPVGRFTLDLTTERDEPQPLASLVAAAAPEVELFARLASAPQSTLPSLADLPGPPAGDEELAIASAAPQRSAPPRDDARTVVEGSWILARTGLWNRGFEAGGSDGRIRITGSVSTERERANAESLLLAAAGGQPLETAISVLAPRPVAPASVAAAGAGQSQTVGGPVRTSLLEHYQDAARRSFQEPDRSLLESELERYVSEVLRHDADLLSHAHALHGLLNRDDIDEAIRTASFPKVVRFHLNAISRHEAGIYGLLSEALPRRFWAHRGHSGDAAGPGSLGAASSRLRQDVLALDRALNSLLFPGSTALDVRESNLSSATLLARVRQHTRQLKAAIRQ